jgi:hypothetical protein
MESGELHIIVWENVGKTVTVSAERELIKKWGINHGLMNSALD